MCHHNLQLFRLFNKKTASKGRRERFGFKSVRFIGRRPSTPLACIRGVRVVVRPGCATVIGAD